MYSSEEDPPEDGYEDDEELADDEWLDGAFDTKGESPYEILFGLFVVVGVVAILFIICL